MSSIECGPPLSILEARPSNPEFRQIKTGERITRSAPPHIFKAVLFDMDGTLVSSLPVIQYCVNIISQKYIGRSMTKEQVITSFGPPARDIIKNLTGQCSTDAITEYYDCYKNNVTSKAIVFDGIPSLLSKIQHASIRTAVVTGIERILMEYTLDAFELRKNFDTIITRDDVVRGKPDPEGVQLALKRIHARSEETILIGDSPLDMKAGKQAGVTTGAAIWSPENIGDPTSENPDHVFHSVQELTRFLFPNQP